MRRVLRALSRVDDAIAVVEALLLALLVAGLVAGGIALVFLQNVLPESRPTLFLSLEVAGIGLAVLGAGLAAAGFAGSARRRSLELWGARIAAVGAFALLVWAAAHLETAVEIVQRAAVLWIGVIGASLATRQRKHITIEVLEKFLGPRTRRVVNGVVSLSAAGLLALLAVVAGQYAFDPKGLADSYVTFFESGFVVRSWWVKAILPAGFAVMTWRMLLIFLETAAGKGTPPHDVPLPQIEHVHDEASWAEESQS